MTSSTSAPAPRAVTPSTSSGDSDTARAKPATTSTRDGGVAITPARFRAQFAPARTRLHALGEQLATVLRRAPSENDAVLTLELRGLSVRLLALSSQIAHLRPPRTDRPDVDALVVNLGSVGHDLSHLAGAASVNSPAQASVATRQLVEHSLRVKAAESSLGHKLGLNG